jgi:hypothetical protein
MFGGGGGGGGGGEARILYHGTSLEAILAIQESGFRVDLSGTNAGAMLGPGVYVTTTLQKALNYAKREGVPGKEPNPAAGGVFELEVNLGRCYTVRSNTPGERTGWASQGYDSAWAAAGIIGVMEENCVRDPARIVRIRNVMLGNTGEARRLGYEVRGGRLEVSAAFVQEQQRLLLEAAQASEVWDAPGSRVAGVASSSTLAAKVTQGGWNVDEEMIYVATLTGMIITLPTNRPVPGITVKEVKAQTFQRQGIPPALQTLVFAGEELEDGPLGDYGIQNKSTLHLALRLRGCRGCQVCAQSTWLGHASPESGLRLRSRQECEVGPSADRETVLQCVSQQGQALRDASTELQADKEVVLVAVAQDGLALQFASERLQRDDEVRSVAFAQPGSVHDP